MSEVRMRPAVLSHATSTRKEVDVSEQPWGDFGYFKGPEGHLWEVPCHPELAATDT
ncbi:hypothetical protein [Myxococcus virescens]|uniref:Uncharacterized protein n=2 Tax=Myxococcus virescens TaxID=83456 RepID=A0A511HKF1_9BACT|nr:hypothetical protein [Myxococcus virescens]GEL74041.1 hypothetical protein MVI01_58250 [Myxococcus virescens]